MSVPSLTEFRDATTKNTKGVQYSSAVMFFNSVDSSLSSGNRLYKERFLRYLRSAKAGEENTCFMGQCRAEMKRNVTYVVHLLVDKSNEVLETNCECAAGMGPAAHCKHIQATMLALVDISEGKDPLLELSCTDKLQTFHRPKKIHCGSPVKASDIQQRKEETIFDPRPAEFRSMPFYPDHLKNLVINYCCIEKSNMPLLQTIHSANMYAFDHDHQYFKDLPSEHFLKQMNITSITPEQADEIEASTVNHDAKWRSERLNRMHSSCFGRILKTVSSDAKRNLAQELIHGKQFTSKYTDHGLRNEPKAIFKYEKMKNVVVKACGIVVCMDTPYLASTPDGLVGEDIVLEVKCPYTARNKPISPQTVPYLEANGENLKLAGCHDYYAQVQGQMLATERRLCHFVVYTLLPDIKIIEVPYDEQFVQEMLEKLNSFFLDYFKPAYLNRHYFKDV